MKAIVNAARRSLFLKKKKKSWEGDGGGMSLKFFLSPVLFLANQLSPSSHVQDLTLYIYIYTHTLFWWLARGLCDLCCARPCGRCAGAWASSARDACSRRVLRVFASRGWTCRGTSELFGCSAQAWLCVLVRGFRLTVDPALVA